MKKILYAVIILVVILAIGLGSQYEEIIAGKVTILEAALPLVLCWICAFLFCEADKIVTRFRNLSKSTKKMVVALALLVIIEVLYLIWGGPMPLLAGFGLWLLLMTTYALLRMSRR